MILYGKHEEHFEDAGDGSGKKIYVAAGVRLEFNPGSPSIKTKLVAAKPEKAAPAAKSGSNGKK